MATDFSELHLLKRAIAASSNGIVISDANPQNPIIYCNRAFEKLTGYSSQEVMGNNCRFLQGPDSDFQALEQIIGVQNDISNTYSEQFRIEIPVRDRTNLAIRESKSAKGL